MLHPADHFPLLTQQLDKGFVGYLSKDPNDEIYNVDKKRNTVGKCVALDVCS